MTRHTLLLFFLFLHFPYKCYFVSDFLKVMVYLDKRKLASDSLITSICRNSSGQQLKESRDLPTISLHKLEIVKFCAQKS